MPSDQYNRVEDQICEAIAFQQDHPDIPLTQIARDFGVPYQRFRIRLKGGKSQNEKTNDHLFRLNLDQEKALYTWITALDDMGIPPAFSVIKVAAYNILCESSPPGANLPPLGEHWVKRFIQRSEELHKVKRKTMPINRKNAHDVELLSAHFQRFQDVCARYGMQLSDIWNFDETPFRMGIAKGDHVVTQYPRYQSYRSDPDNRESCTVIEGVSATGIAIPAIIIMTGTLILARWVENSMDPDTLITTSPTGYTCDFIGLRWIEHFHKYSKKTQQGAYRLLILDGHASHITKEFLTYAEDHKIVCMGLPPHTTHLLQPLDVGVFQPYKHWHAQAVNRAVDFADTEYSKQEFLASFKHFRDQTMKQNTIRSAWRKTGLVPYNPDIVLDKIRDHFDKRPITPEEELPDFNVLNHTPHGQQHIANFILALVKQPDIPDHVIGCIYRLGRRALIDCANNRLFKQQLEATDKAKRARKSRKSLPRNVLQTGGILSASMARDMNQDRYNLECERWRKTWMRKKKKALKQLHHDIHTFCINPTSPE